MEHMSLIPSLWALLLLPVAFNQNEESCQLFFTVQPPPSLPCNPYLQTALVTSTMLELQCTVHAPELDLYLMERNYTVEWVRQASSAGGEEEIISTGSTQGGMRVENEHSTYFYAESVTVVGTYVKSVLSINLDIIPTSSLPGRYWCQVLANSLDDYSYKVVGRSNTETGIPTSEDYSLASELSLLPPCLASEGPLYQPYFKCVQNTELSDGQDPVVPREDFVSIPSSVLAAVAVAGGALIVAVLILCLVAAYSCRVVNERRLRGAQRHQVSIQSGEIQEVKTAVHKPVVTSHPAQPLGYKSSLPRRTDSHKGTPMRKGRMPHYSPDQQLIESLTTDTTTYSNRVKSTGSNNTLS